MDVAAQGAAALAASDFPSAITHYNKAISSNPQAVDYYIKRSMAYARLSPADYTSSLKDSEIAVGLANKRGKRELIAESQLRRGVALYGLQRWGDAKQCFFWAAKYNYDEKVLKIWDTKVQAKLKDLEEGDEKSMVIVKEVPEIELPTATETKSSTNDAHTLTKGTENKVKEESFVASKTRYDWYQTGDNVVVTLFAKGIPKDEVKVDLHPKSLQISFPTPSGPDFEYKLNSLYADIDPSASTAKILSTKVEITLRKAQPGQKWSSLESNQTPDDSKPNLTETSSQTSHPSAPSKPVKPTAPAYPTSSKTGPKDWDKLANSFAKKPKTPKSGGDNSNDSKGSSTGKEQDDKNGNNDDDDDDGIDFDMEGGDEVGAFFKQIYKGASPDARRAMMKSYQESNGTALSTNWDEVAKGKVETVPPSGMEEKKWNK